MPKPDDRAQLEAIARGNGTRAKDAGVLTEAVFQKHAPAFRAWATFGENRGREPLAAPADLLTPLP